MRDQLLFVLLPYAAVAALVAVLGFRGLVRSYDEAELAEEAERTRAAYGGSRVLWLALGLVVAGHLLGLLLPAELAAWNRRPWRLVTGELAGLICSSLVLLGLAAAAVARRRAVGAGRLPLSLGDSLLFTLAATTVVSGIAVALTERWGSAWYGATLVPYLGSLARLEPRAELITAMPFLVRLHVVSGFVLLGAAPFSRLAVAVVSPLWTLRRRLFGARVAARAEAVDAG